MLFYWNNQAIVSLLSHCRSVVCLLISYQDYGFARQRRWETAISCVFTGRQVEEREPELRRGLQMFWERK